MAAPFDPYAEWLGLAVAKRPPDYYRLLELDPAERDLEKIAAAADARLAQVRRCRPGPHLAQWQKLLDDLAKAKRVLTDATARGRYDAQLDGELSSPLGGTIPQAAPSDPNLFPPGYFVPAKSTAPRAKESPPAGDPMAPVPSFFPLPASAAEPASAPRVPTHVAHTWPAAEGDADPEPLDISATQAGRARITGKRPWAAAFGLTAASVLLILAIASVLIQSRKNAANLPIAPQPHGSAPDSAGPVDPSQKPPGPQVPVDRPPLDSSPSPRSSADAGNGAARQEPVEKTTKPVAAPRPAEHPEATPMAQVPAASAGPQIPPRVPDNPQAKSEALQTELAAVRTAWRVRDVAQAAAALQRAAGLAVTDTDKVALKRAQRLQKYVEHFWGAVRTTLPRLQAGEELTIGSTIVAVVEAGPTAVTIHVTGANRSYSLASLPAGLALVLAERSLDAQSPDTKVALGAFHAVDAGGQPAEARRLWEEASLDGADVDDLLPLLSGAGATSNENEDASPPADELARAEKRVEAAYARQFRAATTSMKQTDLSKKLQASAEKSQDPAEQFVLLRRAAELANRAGNCSLAFVAVDSLAKNFHIDALAMKAEYLSHEAAPGDKMAAKRRARSAVQLLDEALSQRRPDEAQKLLTIGQSAAQASGDAVLLKQFTHRQEKLTALLKSPPSN